MKKRILAMLFALTLAFSAAGCGGKDTEEQPTEQDQQQEQQDTENQYDPREGASEEALGMLDYLEGLPAEIPQEDAAADGFFTIADGAVVSGQEKWDAFIEAVNAGEEASVVVCQYSMHGGAVLDYVLHRADGGYEVVSDTTRDGYERENGIYERVQKFEAMKVFEDFSLQEGGSSYKICVLSDEANLDEDTFRTYWTEMSTEAHHTYLLFVI